MLRRNFNRLSKICAFYDSVTRHSPLVSANGLSRTSNAVILKLSTRSFVRIAAVGTAGTFDGGDWTFENVDGGI